MSYRVAVVGATGAVGREILTTLAEREFPARDVVALASERSAGASVSFGEDDELKVRDLAGFDFRGTDIVLSSPGAKVSAEHSPRAAAAGAVVIDNTSQFRMDPDVPLVVPEVNPEAIAGYNKRHIIANPNCSTIIMVLPIWPLHKVNPVKRIICSTYQSASGAGALGMQELEDQTRVVLDGKTAEPKVFPHQIAFNLFSHNSDVGEDGYNEEETKMVRETHKIWSDASIRITTTCVRVPVMRAHAESINLEFIEPMDEDQARQILCEAPGVVLLDDREQNHFPTPLDASDQDAVYVGRIRNDISRAGTGVSGLDLFVCGDQLRKGAALNAVQIAELLL